MSRKYKFRNPEGVYFVSFAVVDWVDVFTRNIYKDIVVDSMVYCQKNKGLEIFSWCIMTSHIHLLIRSASGHSLSAILRDFKKFTAKELLKAIRENPQESRKEWMMAQFKRAAQKSSNVRDFQFWRHDNHPIEVWSNKVISQKVNYIHMNPVEEGLVLKPEEYPYSSARDYAGDKGLLDVIIVDI